MKRWLLSLLLLIPGIAQGQANIGGLLFASNFAQWTVPQGNVGLFSWSAPSFCTVSSGGVTFRAFSVGVPVQLIDSENPSLNEVITPIQANYTGFACSISATTQYSHKSFYFQTATAGLGEALSYAGTQPFQVILTPAWQRLGGITSTITSATGNNAVTILDQRSSVIVPYLWNGSAYVATPFGGGANVLSVFGRGGDVTAATGDYSVAQVTGAAPLASPNFSGVPTAPTASTGTNTTQLATTAFVQSAIGSGTGFPINIGNTPIQANGNTTVISKLQTFNGTVYSYAFSGGLAERVNACVLAAQSFTNGGLTGYCDATAENGRQTTDVEIDVGSASGAGVGLLLPCVGVWQASMTNGTSYAMKVYGGATVRSVCPASGIAGQFGITATSGSNLAGIFTTATSTNPYTYLEGFDVVNVTGGHATANGIGFYLSGPMNDGTTLKNVNVYDSLDTYAVKAYNVSAATVWENSSINANYGGTPFWSSTDANGYVTSLTLQNMTIGHAGTGLPEVLCTDTRSVTPKISSLHIDHSYTETGTDGTTADIQIQGCNKVSVTQHTFKSQSTGRTAPGITVTNAYNTDLEVDGLTFGQGSGTYTYPATAVVNSFTGETWQTDSLGHFSHYNSPSSVNSGLQAYNNLSDLKSASTARTNLGLGSAATQPSTAFDTSVAAAAAQAASLQKANNLSDVSSPPTALANIGGQAALGYIPAHSGSNSDITALSGLTTPLSIPQGGTGSGTAAGALSNALGNPAVGNYTINCTTTSACTPQAANPGYVMTGYVNGGIASPTVIANGYAPSAGHITALQVMNQTGNSCTTPPTFNVFDGTSTIGTALQGSSSLQTKGLANNQTENIAVAKGDNIGAYISTSGSGCGSAYFLISVTVTVP